MDFSYKQACSLIYKQSAKLAQSNGLYLKKVLSKLSFIANIRHSLACELLAQPGYIKVWLIQDINELELYPVYTPQFLLQLLFVL